MATFNMENNNKNRSFLIVITLVVIAALIAVVFFVYNNKNKAAPENIGKNLEVSYTEQSDMGSYIEFKLPGANKKVIDNFSDPQCDHCATFKKNNEENILQALKMKHTLRFHPMTFLDKQNNNDYSSRVTEALVILAKNNESQAAWELYNEIWDNQEATTTNAQLADFSQNHGASPESAQKIRELSEGTLGKSIGDVNFSAVSQNIGQVTVPLVLIDRTTLVDPINNTQEIPSKLR